MSERHYSQLVLRELNRLGELASVRESESRLKAISSKLNRWKKGDMTSSLVLTEINRLSGASPVTWSVGADPGVHVSYAVAAGYLSRKDFSDSAWKAIEILITLAEI